MRTVQECHVRELQIRRLGDSSIASDSGIRRALGLWRPTSTGSSGPTASCAGRTTIGMVGSD